MPIVIGLHGAGKVLNFHDLCSRVHFEWPSPVYKSFALNVLIQDMNFLLPDVDECSLEKHECHADADCRNGNGTYHCECRDGYTGDGLNCTGNTLLTMNYILF